jgi:hypothetical protein
LPYERGSDGPSAAASLPRQDGRKWRPIGGHR